MNDPEEPCRRRYIRLLPLKAAAHTEPRRWPLTLPLDAVSAAVDYLIPWNSG
jgi:hypothetical protein